MDNSVLYPPNLQRFGNDVIGKVALREASPFHAHSTFNADDNDDSAAESPRVLPSPKPPIKESTAQKKGSMAKSVSGSKKRPVLDEAEELELRRSRRRANMQRYRSKLRNHATTLEDDVQHLQREIQQLQIQYNTVLASAKVKTAWSVAAEYFRLFVYGLKEDFSMTEPTHSPSSSLGVHAQQGFLCANMASDVVGSTGCGARSLIEDFRRLTLYLPNLSTRLLRMEMGPRESIIATTRVELTLTANTIRLAFPHLIHNERWSQVANTLLDQKFVMKGTTHFEWDSEVSRVTLLQSRADLLTPMLKLLGDLETVAYVFEAARITPECTVSSEK